MYDLLPNNFVGGALAPLFRCLCLWLSLRTVPVRRVSAYGSSSSSS